MTISRDAISALSSMLHNTQRETKDSAGSIVLREKTFHPFEDDFSIQEGDRSVTVSVKGSGEVSMDNFPQGHLTAYQNLLVPGSDDELSVLSSLFRFNGDLEYALKGFKYRPTMANAAKAIIIDPIGAAQGMRGMAHPKEKVSYVLLAYRTAYDVESNEDLRASILETLIDYEVDLLRPFLRGAKLSNVNERILSDLADYPLTADLEAPFEEPLEVLARAYTTEQDTNAAREALTMLASFRPEKLPTLIDFNHRYARGNRFTGNTLELIRACISPELRAQLTEEDKIMLLKATAALEVREEDLLLKGNLLDSILDLRLRKPDAQTNSFSAYEVEALAGLETDNSHQNKIAVVKAMLETDLLEGQAELEWRQALIGYYISDSLLHLAVEQMLLLPEQQLSETVNGVVHGSITGLNAEQRIYVAKHLYFSEQLSEEDVSSVKEFVGSELD